MCGKEQIKWIYVLKYVVNGCFDTQKNNLTGSRWRNFKYVTTMITFWVDRNIFSELPCYLEYNATKSVAEIFTLVINDQYYFI